MFNIRNTLLTFTIFILFIANSFAQVNIETLRNEKEDKSVSFELGGGAEIKFGNVDVTKINTSALVHYFILDTHLFSKVEYIWGSQNQIDFEESSFLHARATKMINNLFGLEVFTQFQNNKFTSLNLRQLNGLGTRLELYKDKHTILSLGIGGMSDYEIVNINNIIKKSLDPRGTSYISFLRSIDDKNTLSATLYYQPHILRPLDYRINVEGLIRLSLIKKLNIFIDNTFNYQRDTNPPKDINVNDFSTNIKITYKW